ncbi:MAG: hypothetical protein K0Q59_4894 [Paenibacillus sp.]|jgi:uncharacterized protein YrzB (UPF0473 family)|nr:hypothetical protein [Paenibacillus sp.]
MSDHKHDDNCGCGEDHGEEVLILTDEDGNEHEMVIVYTFETKEKTYAVLLDRNDPESDSIIFRMEEEGDELTLVDIEDDAEWEHVSSVYEEILQSEVNA